jgi:hypothetical protein
MVVQSNNTPWVILAFMILCMAVAFGMILTGVPFGTSQDVKDEQARANILATEGAISAIETPQAAFAGQTAVVAELTAMPPIQTATAIVVEENLVLAQQAATQTKIAGEIYLGNLAVAATATAMVPNTTKHSTTSVTSFGFVIAGMTIFGMWIIGHIVIAILSANTQNKFAQARLFREQRQLAEFRSSHQKAQVPIVQPQIPMSLMKLRGNGHEYPRGE